MVFRGEGAGLRDGGDTLFVEAAEGFAEEGAAGGVEGRGGPVHPAIKGGEGEARVCAGGELGEFENSLGTEGEDVEDPFLEDEGFGLGVAAFDGGGIEDAVGAGLGGLADVVLEERGEAVPQLGHVVELVG